MAAPHRRSRDEPARGSEEYLAGVFAAAADGIVVVDECGCVELANPVAERLLGYARGDLIGVALAALVPDATSGTADDPLAPYLRIETVGARRASQTASGRRADGSTVDLRVWATESHFLGGSRRTIVILHDAGELRRLEDERDRAREATEALGRVIESLEAHVYSGVIAPDSGYAEVFTGPGAEQLLGGPVPDDAQPGATWLQCIHPDDRDAYAEACSYARLSRLEPFIITYRLIGLDGVERTIRDRMRPRRSANGELHVDGILWDVTEQRRMREKLDSTQLRLDSVLGVIDDVLYEAELDVDGRIVRFESSSDMTRFTGGGAIESGAWRSMVDPRDADAYHAYRASVVAGRASSLEYRLIGADGVTRWIWARSWLVRERDGRRVNRGVVSDVTERRRMLDELATARDEAEKRARVDVLTGLYNRRHFTETLEIELARAEPEGQTPGLVMLDLDHFKRVNDQHGHRVGDEVLMAVSQRLHQAVRTFDTVARWGGEEFCVLVPGVPSEVRLRELAEEIRRAISSQPIALAGGDVRVTASVGAVRCHPGLLAPDALLDAADRALYAAKRHGRNRTSLFADLTVDDLVSEEPEAIRIAQALALSASVREGMPARHSEEVATLAAKVAGYLELPAHAVERCRLAGWLHDAGKVAIPDRILTKPGPLDEQEWAVMRRHAEIGEQIARRVVGLADAATVVRHHHEHFNGGGYPDGLVAEAIPLEARIIAVVDAFSTITSERPYKKARDRTEAIAELKRSAGTHLDPRVVDAFCDVVDENDG